MNGIKPIAALCSFAVALLTLGLAACEDPGTPTITSVEPMSAPADSLVIVEGSNLADITRMTFDGELVNFNTAFNSDIALQFRVPPNVEAREYNVVITTDGGSAEFPFRVTLDAPLVLGFTEPQGAIGSVTTIFGENFFEPLEVYFASETDSVKAEILNLQSDSIRVRVPEGAGRSFVYVHANGGTSRSQGIFEVVRETLVSDFDGNGVRGDASAYVFRGGLAFTGADAVRASNPEPVDGNFLKIQGQSSGSSFIGSVRTPTIDRAEFENFGLEALPRFTFLEFDYNNNGRTATRLTVVIKERDGSRNDFSREYELDGDGWVSTSQPLARFLDIDGLPVDPEKAVSITFNLLDTDGSGEPFEANIDNIRFVELPE